MICKCSEHIVPSTRQRRIRSRRTTTIIGGSCHKYNFCRDKYLSRQKFCRDKITLVVTKVLSRQAYLCRDKRRVLSRQIHNGQNVSSAGAATSIYFLSRETCVCHDKTRLLSRQNYDKRRVLLRQIYTTYCDVFVATKVCLSRQNVCCDKIVCRDKRLFCRDKHVFVVFVATKHLSRQK